MRTRSVAPLAFALASIVAAAPPARAQHGPLATTPDVVTAPPAEAHQFDFLLGDWSLVALPHVSKMVALVHGQPKLGGRWKAWRSVEGFGIEDELRLTTDGGDPALFAHSLRIFDRAARRWSAATVDVYRTRLQTATATWKDGVMETSGESTTDDGHRYLSRARFTAIGRDSFHYELQRSYDGGTTWEDPQIVIEAHRAAPAPR